MTEPYDYLDPDDWDDDPAFDDDIEEGLGFDCHMDRHGQCGKAGSEECDFECPLMAEIHQKEATKRKAKK